MLAIAISDGHSGKYEDSQEGKGLVNFLRNINFYVRGFELVFQHANFKMLFVVEVMNLTISMF